MEKLQSEKNEDLSPWKMKSDHFWYTSAVQPPVCFAFFKIVTQEIIKHVPKIVTQERIIENVIIQEQETIVEVRRKTHIFHVICVQIYQK